MSMSRSMSLVVAPAAISKDNDGWHGMQVRLSPYQVRDNVPMFALHGFISRPLPGAQVAVMMQGNNPSNAIGIGVNDPRYYRAGLPPGTVGIDHHLGAHVLAFDDRLEVDGGGRLVVVKNASKVRIEGDLEVTGEVTARCDGGAVHLSTHQTTNVQNGGGTSGPPKPNT